MIIFMADMKLWKISVLRMYMNPKLIRAPGLQIPDSVSGYIPQGEAYNGALDDSQSRIALHDRV